MTVGVFALSQTSTLANTLTHTTHSHGVAFNSPETDMEVREKVEVKWAWLATG